MLNLTFSGQLWNSKVARVLTESENYFYDYIGGTPYDGRPIDVAETVEISLMVVFIVLATVGIVLAIICLVFNFIFRERK